MLFPVGEAECYDKIRWLLDEFEAADSFYVGRSHYLIIKVTTFLPVSMHMQYQ